MFSLSGCAALIIRAISVLEGIALVADPEFQIIQAAYPFISRKLLTDQSPRLKAALHYMVCMCAAPLLSITWTPHTWQSLGLGAGMLPHFDRDLPMAQAVVANSCNLNCKEALP